MALGKFYTSFTGTLTTKNLGSFKKGMDSNRAVFRINCTECCEFIRVQTLRVADINYLFLHTKIPDILKTVQLDRHCTWSAISQPPTVPHSIVQ